MSVNLDLFRAALKWAKPAVGFWSDCSRVQMLETVPPEFLFGDDYLLGPTLPMGADNKRSGGL